MLFFHLFSCWKIIASARRDEAGIAFFVLKGAGGDDEPLGLDDFVKDALVRASDNLSRTVGKAAGPGPRKGYLENL
jgi:hypothetical protein